MIYSEHLAFILATELLINENNLIGNSKPEECMKECKETLRKTLQKIQNKDEKEKGNKFMICSESALFMS